VAIAYRDQNLFAKLASLDVFNGDNVIRLKRIASEYGFKQLEVDATTYMQEHFDKVVRSEYVKTWPKDMIDETTKMFSGPYSSWCTFCNWLDILWFSHHTENNELKTKAVESLVNLINIENVVPVLVASHNAGEKPLRNKCVDFLIEHAPYVEQFQRMKLHADFDMCRVATLSASIRGEFISKVKKRVSTLKTDMPKSKAKVSMFNKKKRTCNLCKRVVEIIELKQNVVLPEVFGYTKPKQICASCETLATLIT